jgi:hypothetical protein
MQYAAHLPNTRALVAPIVALAIGAAGATGIYALVDENSNSTPAAIVISEPVTTGPNEAGVAAAVSSAPVVSSSSSVDEAGVAAAVSSAPVVSQASGKDEASTAAAIGQPAQPVGGPDESSTASFIGGAH